MSDPYTWLKLVHVVSATILFGTGIGTAFQMWMAHLDGEPRVVAAVAGAVVRADLLFTTPAVVIQPASGLALVWLGGIDPLASWLVVVYALYALAGACWLPVVVLQLRIRDLARTAVLSGADLPPVYRRLIWIWFALGWPAFGGLIAVFWLMVAKPELW